MNTGRSLWASIGILLIASLAGCVSQEQYDEALRINAEQKASIEKLQTSLAQAEDDLRAARARITELTAARADEQRRLAAAENIAEQLRREIEAARKSLEQARTGLDAQVAELQHAIEIQREARLKAERELADRERELDVLRSRLREIQDRLEELNRRVTAATTAPALDGQ